jgi:hypothetical protein
MLNSADSRLLFAGGVSGHYVFAVSRREQRLSGTSNESGLADCWQTAW